MTNILLEIIAIILGIFVYSLVFKLLLLLKQRSVFFVLAGGAIGFLILLATLLVLSRHPDLGGNRIVLGSVVFFVALLFAFFACKIKKTPFVQELCFIFLQMALGLAILTILGNAFFEISSYLGFDNAYNDTSAYIVIDPLHYSYIAVFVITSVLYPILASK